MTKQDLLNRMSALNACYEATDWVTAQEGTALEIGLRSDRIDWLVWLIGRIDPVAIADFARRCTDRAEGYAAADRAAYAARVVRATAYAARAAAYAYADAAYYAAYYADRAVEQVDRAYAADADRAADAERRTQRTDLHALWIEITKGV